MKRLMPACALAMVPFAANAADLYTDYSFIQENAPGTHQRQVRGELEFSAGWIRDALPAFDIEDEQNLFEAWGRANIPFAGNWNLELETGGEAKFQDGASNARVGAYAHLWGGGSDFRVGGFGGVKFLEEGELGIAGLEGEVDIGDLTFGVQGAYNQWIDCDNCSDVWSGRAWADFYPAPNTRLGIGGQYFSYVAGDPSDGWGVSGIAEHRFAGTPLSAFVRGEYLDFFEGISEIQVTRALAGLHIFVGDADITLQQHYRQVPFDVRPVDDVIRVE